LAEQKSSERLRDSFASIRLLTRNKAFLLLLFGDVCVGLAFAIIDFPLIVYLVSLGYETVMIGRLISAGLVAMIIAQVPAGLLIDRIGRKNGILLGLCIYAIFPVFYPFCVKYLWFLVIAIISGVANAILTPASFTFVAEIVPREIRGSAMALAYFTSGILNFGPFLGGVFYTIHKTVPFVVCSVLTISTALVFYVFLPQLESRNTGNRSIKDIMKSTKVLRKSLIGVFFAVFAYSLGAGILFLVVPIFFLTVLGETVVDTGFALIVPQVICFVLSLLIGRWIDRHKGKKNLLILGLVGCGIVALTFTLITTALEAVLVWTFLMLTGIFIGSSSLTMVSELSEESSKTMAMSVYSFFGTLGIVVGMQLVGNIQKSSLSSQTTFYPLPVLCALAAVIVSITIKEKK